MWHFNRKLPTVPTAGHIFWQILFVTILASATMGCDLVGAKRDTSFAESSGNQLACIAYSDFIDRHARRFAQHEQVYSMLQNASLEADSFANLSMSFLLDLKQESVQGSLIVSMIDADPRLQDALLRTRDYGQQILGKRNSDDFWANAFEFSHIDNTLIGDAAFKTPGPQAPHGFALPRTFGGPSLGQLCLAAGFTVPNTVTFADASNRNSFTGDTEDRHFDYCVRYKEGVEASYDSISTSVADFSSTEAHRLAATGTPTQINQITLALFDISRRESTFSAELLEQFENMTADERADFIDAGGITGSWRSNFQVTAEQLSRSMATARDAMLQLRLVRFDPNVEGALADEFYAATDAATMDMLLLSSVCKASGFPYADQHGEIV